MADIDAVAGATPPMQSNTSGSTTSGNAIENGKTTAGTVLATMMSTENEDVLRRYLAQSVENQISISSFMNKSFDLRGLMGAPFKFSKTDDPPTNAPDGEYGRSYLEGFIEWGNIVAFTPGVAMFLPGMGKDEREKFLTNTVNSEGKSDENSELDNEDARAAIKEAGTKKLYTFRPASSIYWDYVNTIWRHLMALTNLGNYESRIASYYTKKALLGGATTKASTHLGDIRWGSVNESSDLNRILYGFIGDSALSRPETTYSFVPFYNDGPISSNDGFDNQAGESSFGAKINQLPGEEISRELGFLTGVTYRDTTDYSVKMKDQKSTDDSLGNQILSMKSLGVKTIIPDVWKDSGSSGREVTFNFKFACCDGAPECYAMHTLRPLCHLLAMALPIHHKGNFAFAAPLLVRVWAKGISNIDIGMITSLTIQKDPKSITAYGLMTDMTVSVTVRDLTPVVALPHDKLGRGADSAVGYMSLIGGLSGCNVALLNWEKLNVFMEADSWIEWGRANHILNNIGRLASDSLGKFKAFFNKI